MIKFILILEWISKKYFKATLYLLTFYDLPSLTGTLALYIGAKLDSTPTNECSFACGSLWTSNDRMLWISTIFPLSFSCFTILISYSLSFKYISSLVSSTSNLSLNGFVIPTLFSKRESILVIKISYKVVILSSSKWRDSSWFSMFAMPLLCLKKSIANNKVVI